MKDIVQAMDPLSPYLIIIAARMRAVMLLFFLQTCCLVKGQKSSSFAASYPCDLLINQAGLQHVALQSYKGTAESQKHAQIK